MKYFYYLTLVLLALSAMQMQAQQYEMQLVHLGGTQMALQMRETTGGVNTPSTMDGYTNINFAISWPQSCGGGQTIDLSVVSPGMAGHEDYSVNRNLQKYEVATDFVRVFQTPASFTFFPENWTDNTFVTVATIEVAPMAEGTCDFCLVTTNLMDNSIPIQEVSSGPKISMAYANHPTLPPSSMEYDPVINNGKATAVPLPVELLSFSAKAKDNYVGLAWASAAEIAFDGYQLERSDDGKNFKEIAWIAGAGDALSPTTYTHEDKDIIAGRIYYYRLAMHDLDNSVEHSSIEVVEIDAKFSVASFPKPTRDFLNIHIESAADTDAVLHLVDIHGRVVREQNLEVEEGANKFLLNAEEITNGVYFLIIRSNAWQHAEEVIFLK